jgi:CHASE2 domain-containing sensor protein
MKLYEILQLVGLALLSVGCFILAVWLGFIVTGILVLAYGIAQERGVNNGAV